MHKCPQLLELKKKNCPPKLFDQKENKIVYTEKHQ